MTNGGDTIVSAKIRHQQAIFLEKERKAAQAKRIAEKKPASKLEAYAIITGKGIEGGFEVLSRRQKIAEQKKRPIGNRPFVPKKETPEEKRARARAETLKRADRLSKARQAKFIAEAETNNPPVVKGVISRTSKPIKSERPEQTNKFISPITSAFTEKKQGIAGFITKIPESAPGQVVVGFGAGLVSGIKEFGGAGEFLSKAPERVQIQSEFLRFGGKKRFETDAKFRKKIQESFQTTSTEARGAIAAGTLGVLGISRSARIGAELLASGVGTLQLSQSRSPREVGEALVPLSAGAGRVTTIAQNIGIQSTRKFVPIEQIARPKVIEFYRTGKGTRFPEASSPAESAQQFRKAKFAIRKEQKGAAFFSASERPPKSGDIVGLGSSESVGLFGAPDVSINFLRLSEQRQIATPTLFSSVKKNPVILSARPKEVRRIPKTTLKQGLSESNKFLIEQKAKEKVFVTPGSELGITREAEVVATPGSRIIRDPATTGKQKLFTRFGGKNVPIEEIKFVRAKKSEVTTTQTRKQVTGTSLGSRRSPLAKREKFSVGISNIRRPTRSSQRRTPLRTTSSPRKIMRESSVTRRSSNQKKLSRGPRRKPKKIFRAARFSRRPRSRRTSRISRLSRVSSRALSRTLSTTTKFKTDQPIQLTKKKVGTKDKDKRKTKKPSSKRKSTPDVFSAAFLERGTRPFTTTGIGQRKLTAKEGEVLL